MTTTLNHPETKFDAKSNGDSSRGFNLPASQLPADPQRNAAGLDQSTTNSQMTDDSQIPAAVGGPIVGSSHVDYVNDQHTIAAADSTSPPTIRPPMPTNDASAGSPATEDHPCSDTQPSPVLGPNVSSDHGMSDSHRCPAAADQTTPPSQSRNGPQTSGAGRGPILRDGLLAIMADAVDDLERTRIANENRYRQLTRVGSDSDGEERGFGLDDSVVEVKRVHQVVDGLAALEHQAILAMRSQVRKHPLWKTWASQQKGFGEKQFARLLAAVGDPYWNDLHDRPRIVSELWAYCGYHVVHPGGQMLSGTQNHAAAGVAPKRQRGQKSNWSETARMRVWNITGSCLKAQGHYSTVYYKARDKYEGALHPAPCVRCGPKNHPAPAGSSLSAAHQHARGLRIMAKEILLDLWLASRELHGS